jgi:hypothetical protein
VGFGIMGHYHQVVYIHIKQAGSDHILECAAHEMLEQRWSLRQAEWKDSPCPASSTGTESEPFSHLMRQSQLVKAIREVYDGEQSVGGNTLEDVINVGKRKLLHLKQKRVLAVIH